MLDALFRHRYQLGQIKIKPLWQSWLDGQGSVVLLTFHSRRPAGRRKEQLSDWPDIDWTMPLDDLQRETGLGVNGLPGGFVRRQQQLRQRSHTGKVDGGIA